MNTAALITMVLAQGIVICLTGFFFYKVLTTPPVKEPDSFEDNDDELIRKND
ncbi:hypothetical protein FLCU109888_04635 [Flavobacterium cucumis]|uniref:Uncharacterized protein n=1 Tax=Flavobacterium cucumis TaxID=416016 RepID=A0A1M7ZSK0_9FLAO|nr:hypothetical protein [Flavobacterium cucumis]SHO71869.1 hypothetical protein SAMN05443547_0185 [Flavobacterium cucumis]